MSVVAGETMTRERTNDFRLGYTVGVGRIGWHLDDVPQPYLTYRRIAFAVIVLLVAAAIPDGLLLGYDATHHRSLAMPLLMTGTTMVIGMMAGAVFGWSN